MNKLTIPAILVATVMVAGIFAFMPVEQASTVHTTIQGTQLKAFTIADATGPADVEDVGNTATATTQTLNLPADAIITEIVLQIAGGDAADSVTITSVTFDGGGNVLLAATADLFTDADGAIDVLDALKSQGLFVSGAGAADIAIIFSVNAGDAASAGGDATSTLRVSGTTTDTTNITLD